MYKRFFGIESNPFSGSPDPRFLHMMPHTREALAALEYGITTRKGFIVLTGEVGTGKTTLLRHVLNSFNPELVLTSFVFNPRMDFIDFLEFVLCDFGLSPTARTKSGMLIQLNRWLIERFWHGQTCVVVVDEAQNLSCDLMEEIRLLTNLETSSEKLLQIVISGQPELEEKLKQDDLRQLRQRVALWCRTQALTHQQTVSYIEERLKIAGAVQPVFTEDAATLIHRASAGIPRVINLICEHSMILAYVEELLRIPAALVGAVIQDLDLELTTSPCLSAFDQGDGDPLTHDHSPLSSNINAKRLSTWTEGERRDL
ncbi:general secretion pathway protein A [Granulicella pectinivorans]|uniref:General secretion pathway protein A n=1 Tax=Granulicella pectinivorans TaxID=474950 RepID=A0A1I6MMF4_9BACT|nr:AAA family ATPase [Granulicella pectinivorans]SFS16834.1 general secretion pathway protein A [Granulicella pectinivorans]